MPRVTIEKDGEQQEIEVSSDNIQYGDDETPSGFVAQDSVDSIVQQRLQRQERSLKSSLKEDDSFFQEAAQERGIELRDDGQPKGALKDEELQELRQIKARYEGLKEEVPALKNQLDSLRETSLESELLRAAGDVKPDLQDAFLQIAKQNFKFDQETGKHVLTDQDGGVRYQKGSAEPATAQTFVEEMREQKPSFFKPSKMQGGPDTKPGGNASSTKRMSRSEWEEATGHPERYSDSEWQEILSAEVVD